MSEMQAVRALVSERLAVAAEEIVSAVGRMITEKRTLSAPEMPPEQQRAVVHERLSVAADEIFRSLARMMGERDADVCGPREGMKRHRELLDVTWETGTKLHRTDGLPRSYGEEDVTPKLLRCEWSRISSQCQETSNPLQISDASTERANKACARAERCSSSMVASQTPGEQRVVPERDQSDPSPGSSEAGTDRSDAELNEKSLKSTKRKGFQRRGRGADGCKMCGAPLPKGQKLEQHSRTITPPSKIPTTRQSCCRVCGKVFRYKRSFLKHVLQHEQTSDRCGACGKHLGSDESLRAHLQSHKDENRPSEAERSDAESEGSDGRKDGDAADCPDGEGGEARFRKPPKSEEQRSNKATGSKNKDASRLRYRCKVCCRAFCYRASFLKHVQEDERDAAICGVCGERFHSEDSLRRHLRTYVPANDCEVCGKHFDGHKQLEMHARTHTGEKPYICAVCGKAFAQNGNLAGHMRVHTGERPYVCSVCGQGFGFKEYMTAHMRIHTGEKPFLCSVCGKGFRQRGTLKTHAMIHTGESTHHCGVCGKKFYKSGALKVHMRAHTGEKPYVCNVCGKSFAAGGSLTKHMGVHEGAPTRGDLKRSRGRSHAADESAVSLEAAR